MKKLIPLLMAVFTFTACEKDADTDKLDNKFVVYTNYGQGVKEDLKKANDLFTISCSGDSQ